MGNYKYSLSRCIARPVTAQENHSKNNSRAPEEVKTTPLPNPQDISNSLDKEPSSSKRDIALERCKEEAVEQLAVSMPRNDSKKLSNPVDTQVKLFQNEKHPRIKDSNVFNSTYVSIYQKQTFNIDIELDLDVFQRIDKLYFDLIKRTSYYLNATPEKKKDKLIAFQIICRYAFLKKLLLSTTEEKALFVTRYIHEDLMMHEFHVPIALHSIVNCYGRFYFRNHSAHIKDDIFIINNIAGDIVRLCATHSKIGASSKIPHEASKNKLKTLVMGKIHFMNENSTSRLKEQASVLLERLCAREVIFDATPSTGEKDKATTNTMPRQRIVVRYPELKHAKDSPVSVSDYKKWTKKLHKNYPHFEELVITGAALISKINWFLGENLNTPITRLQPDLEIEGLSCTPNDILNHLGWKDVQSTGSNSTFQALLRLGWELAKSHVFNGMLRTQMSFFSNIGNRAQLVTFDDSQKEMVCNEDYFVYCDLVPSCESQLMFSAGDAVNTKIGHMFGISKALNFTPKFKGKLKHGIQESRMAYVARDLIASAQKKI